MKITKSIGGPITVLAIGAFVSSMAFFLSRETYPTDRLDPRALRDAGWSSFLTPDKSADCPEPDVNFYDKDWPQAKTDPTFLNGGSLVAVKSSWCSRRHVQIVVTYHSTDSSALRRTMSWKDNGEGIEISLPSSSHFNIAKLKRFADEVFEGRSWSVCIAELRLGNYVMNYRLDVADDPDGCEKLARHDVEAMRAAMDALIAARKSPE